VVQFYGDDLELAASVSNYLGEGLVGANSALVLATLPHRLAIEAELAAAGIDVSTAKATGRLLVRDAAQTLEGFWPGDQLDHNRFDAIVSGLIGSAAGAGRPVRIYAEMVTLLWDSGQVAAALELELLWNDLGSRLPFSLLCGYPTRLVAGEDYADDLAEVRDLHSALIGYLPGRPDDATVPYQHVPAVRTFPRAAESARAARHFVFDALSQREDQTLAVDAAIVTAELAANAVVHARSAFTVTVSQSGTGVRISVRDAAPLPAATGHARLAVSRGHGLWVVGQVADNWAVEPLPDGKVVWAELAASSR
jgi:anti-sigma regulatory factor (Ser/Thr protein kinase)